MIKLMKLELKRVSLRTYLNTSVIFCVILLIFIYFIAYVAQVENEVQFQNYQNIFRFMGAISIILFSILSSVMYSHLVIGEYTGRRLALLFSYPGSRKKILAAKILVVFLFILVSMLLCTAIPFILFILTESISPLVHDKMTLNLLVSVFQTMLFSIAAVGEIGILSMRIGFIKKSVPATLISAFCLSGLYGNIAIGAVGKPAIYLLTAGISLVIVIIVLIELSSKINHMEAI